MRYQGFNVFSSWLISGSQINIRGTSSIIGESKHNYDVKGSVCKTNIKFIELFLLICSCLSNVFFLNITN